MIIPFNYCLHYFSNKSNTVSLIREKKVCHVQFIIPVWYHTVSPLRRYKVALPFQHTFFLQVLNFAVFTGCNSPRMEPFYQL